MSRNVIVIGGVALGPKAASRLKRLDPTANVTMIDENINISFGGCGIPYYVSGEINSLDALRSTTYGTVRTPEYFEHKGVHTLNQTRVTAIDRASKTVTAKNLVTGEEKALPYDRLIIATGSTPKVPPVEGRDLKNVGGANNLEDADALRKACASGSVQNAVVIGAGFIGMEIAVALADMWDIKTSVVEFMPQAMPGVMSASLSDMVRHDLEEHNVDVYTGEKVQRLEGENGVVARVVTDKRTLDADLVIFNLTYVDEANRPLPQPDFSGFTDEILDEDGVWQRCFSLAETRIYYVVAWNKLYRRSLFQHLRYAPGKRYEDQFLLPHLLAQCKTIACLAAPGYRYVQRSGSIMAQGSSRTYLDRPEYLLDWCAYFTQKGDALRAEGLLNDAIQNLAEKQCFDLSTPAQQARYRAACRACADSYTALAAATGQRSMRLRAALLRIGLPAYQAFLKHKT